MVGPHCPAAFVILTIALVNGPARGEDRSEIQQLRSEVTALREEVARLRQDDAANWLTARRADEIRALVQDVLADADTRAGFHDGLTAGYDNGFFLASADGNFRIQIAGQIQARFVYNKRSSTGDDHRWGFENRRTKITFSGHVVDPSWTYAIQPAASRSGGSFGLDDAFIRKSLDGGWSIKAGQFIGPFLREELMSSKRQLAAERSLVNNRFGQDRTQGVELAWKRDRVTVRAMYSDGFDRNNTSFAAEDSEYALTGRVQMLAAGTWSQFKDFTSWNSDGFGLLIGAAAHYERAESGTGDGAFVDLNGDMIDDTPNDAEVERFTWTADASMEFGGANLYVAFVGDHQRDFSLDGFTTMDIDEYGLLVQGGFFLVPDELELFARYEWGDADRPAQDDLSVITIGLNRYWHGHGLKWTSDVGYGLNAVTSEWATSGAGWRADAAGDDGQIVVRSQVQLLF